MIINYINDFNCRKAGQTVEKSKQDGRHGFRHSRPRVQFSKLSNMRLHR